MDLYILLQWVFFFFDLHICTIADNYDPSKNMSYHWYQYKVYRHVITGMLEYSNYMQT